MKTLKKRKFYVDKPLLISLGIILLIFVIPITIFLNQKQQTFHEQAAGEPIPQFSHVFVIIEENKDFSQIIGSNEAPYINQLATENGSAANFFAESHPSLPNYIALTSGDMQGITSDCNDCFVNANSIFQELEQNGKTWKSYHEDMPSNCYTNDASSYVMHHNAAAYYTPLKASCAVNDVAYSQFATDLAANSIGNLTFIIPNNNNEMHDGTIQEGDTWLQQNLSAILNSSAYQQNGLIVITWDEDSDNGGNNQVATLLISPLGKKNFTSQVRYDHYSLLRTISDGLGVQPLGNAANAQPMSDFFGQSANPSAPPNASPTFVCAGSQSCVTVSPTQPLISAAPATSAPPPLPSTMTTTIPTLTVPIISPATNIPSAPAGGIQGFLFLLITFFLSLIKALFG